MTIKECEGCNYERSEEKASEYLRTSLCRVYDFPELQHSRIGGCPMRTHNKEEKQGDAFKLNPLKASKRSVK
jgi:hypothetical protein